MQGDPYWLNARYAGKCAKCGAPFGRGDRIFYYPRGRDCFSGPCADAAAADFNRNAQFEADVSAGYSGGGW